MGGRKGGTGPEGHEQGAPIARRDDPAEDRALRSPPLPPALPNEARTGGFANEAKRWRPSFGPPRRAGPRRLNLPNELSSSLAGFASEFVFEQPKGSGRGSSDPLFSSDVFNHHRYILGLWSDVGLCRPLSEAESHLRRAERKL